MIVRLLILAVAGLLLTQCAALPVKVGIVDDALLPCPSTPNCVSSFEDDDHFIEPIDLGDHHDLSMEQLVAVVADMPRTEVIVTNKRYAHITFVTLIMRFKDDVELLRDGQTLHIRSASRVGSSDLGANRSRVEKIREQFQEFLSQRPVEAAESAPEEAASPSTASAAATDAIDSEAAQPVTSE